jgi:DNA-binding IclR family transcriptional regulator
VPGSQPCTQPINLTELSERAGLDKATALRILTTLSTLNLVNKDAESRRYTPGPGLYALLPMDILSISRPHLNALLTEIQKTICLITPQGLLRECIDVLQPARELRVVATLGRVLPIHTGSAGRALLAYLPEPDLDRILKKTEWKAVTPKTERDEITYRRELDWTRALGYARTVGEITHGSSAMGAAVFDRFGNPVVAVTVHGPEARMTHAKVKSLAPALLRATKAISADLGYTGELTKL